MTRSSIKQADCASDRAGSLRGEQGSSLIETALILPVLIIMTLGFIDFSLIVFGMGNANFASRSALRYSTLHSSTSYSATTQQDLDKIIGPYIFNYPANTWSVVSNYTNGNVVGSPVYITVTLTYNLNIFGHLYNGIRYSSTGMGSIQQ